jgi:hypothetical protein
MYGIVLTTLAMFVAMISSSFAMARCHDPWLRRALGR